MHNDSPSLEEIIINHLEWLEDEYIVRDTDIYNYILILEYAFKSYEVEFTSTNQIDHFLNYILEQKGINLSEDELIEECNKYLTLEEE